jgi:hypothetical protein
MHSWRLAHATLKYLWPDTPALRLRLCACFALVALGRGVNLAVPVLYQHVIDRLSHISVQTHSQVGACLGGSAPACRARSPYPLCVPHRSARAGRASSTSCC